LRKRLGRIVVAETRRKQPVTAEDLRVAGAMTVLMKDALRPNLVQTIEGQPTLIHTGPFGNIATGNNSIIADRVGLKLADYAVTEAGFGSDLGFEKFGHIVCRYGNLKPSASVLVATVRALKSHGGVADADLGVRDDAALARGAENLAAHIDIVRTFKIPVVVSINRFGTDSDAEIELLSQLARDAGAEKVVVNEGFERGGEGSVDLANAVVEAAEPPSTFAPLNPPGLQIRAQIERIATSLYGADGVDYSKEAEFRLARFDDLGLGELPVCMAKTHMSLSHDPTQRGRPKGFTLPIRTLNASVGAGFVVALCGDIMLMPGLGRTPAYANVDVDADGRTVGLF
ncbi:MAG TPA: formate--tetrahydrofolate ligase, partial [Actinomycetota bacterium]|nr:formate--tetrahydrofolate ligase [Actinomycetota bacterium]